MNTPDTKTRRRHTAARNVLGGLLGIALGLLFVVVGIVRGDSLLGIVGIVVILCGYGLAVRE